MFRRWVGGLRRDRSRLRDGPGRSGQLDWLLARIVARHFDGASVEGAVVRPGFGDLEIECQVHGPQQGGGEWSAALFFHLSGGQLGAQPILASISGYHARSAEEAVAEGACAWACSFGPVLASAFAGVDDPEVKGGEVTVDGRRWRLVYARFDRVRTVTGADGESLVLAVRARLGGQPYLTPKVIDAVPAELLTVRNASVLSVFVLEGFGNRTVEVKVNGVDTTVPWPTDPPDPLGSDDLVFLRELAVIVPLDGPARSMPLPDPLDRPGLEAVLVHLASTRAGPGQVAGWRGWTSHGGRLGPAITASELERLESSTGPLPVDFRRFLVEVAGPGAGPGYGLEWPRHVGDVVPLAQAGCNAVWVLKIGDDDHGSVWVDSVPVDGRWHRVADSFTAWYRDWLDHALLGRGGWTHWDRARCGVTRSARHLAAQHERSLPRTAAGLADLSGVFIESAIAGWNNYLPPPDGPMVVDPCQGCAETLAQHNVPENVIERGALVRRIR